MDRSHVQPVVGVRERVASVRSLLRGYRWATFSDFYVTRRYEFGYVWHIVRIKGRMGVWLGAYGSDRAANMAIRTAVHHRKVDVPEGTIEHPLFVEFAATVTD